MTEGVDKALWRSNRAILETVLPETAAAFDRGERGFRERVRFETLAGGRVHVTLRAPGGGFRALHSRVNPDREAERMLDQAKIERPHNVIMMGVGLGFALRKLLDRPDRPEWVTAVEGNLDAFWALCRLVDISFLFRTRGLRFLCRPAPERVFSFLQPHSFNILANGLRIVRHQASFHMDREYYSRVESRIHDFEKWAKANVMTQVRAANLFSSNVFSNLGRMIESVPFRAFRERFRGLPAVVIAGGPSLGKNGIQLRKASNRAVLFSVDTALRYLDFCGVKPDFAVSMDFTHNASHYFDGAAGPETFLLVDPEVHPRVVREYPGPVTFCDIEHKAICEWLRECVGDFGVLPKGISVSHTAFSAALYAGCDPIVFVGQDLAYSQNRSHVSGATHGVLVENGEKDIRVPGWFGPVRTSNSLKVFLDHFEEWIASLDRRVINATEGGAQIRGAEHMPLREAILEFPEPETPIREVCRGALAAKRRAVPRRETLRAFLEEGVGELLGLAELCGTLQKDLEALASALGRPDCDPSRVQSGFRRYRDHCERLKRFSRPMERVRDNMFEAHILKARRFHRDFDELDLENHRDEAIRILSVRRAYYEKMENAVKNVSQQIRSSAIFNERREQES